MLPYPQGASRHTNWFKGLKIFQGCKWDFFFLLLIFLFRDSKRYSPWSHSIQGGGIPSKKSSLRLVDIFKSLESVGLPASTLGGRVLPYPQGASRHTNWFKGLKIFQGCKWDFFFLLLIFLFRDSKRYSPWSHSIQGGGIPSKKSSLRLVDDEIFLTHWVKSCLMIYNKCIVIYYKIVGEGIPSKKSSRRLVAHETKRYFFEGTLLGVHHQKNVLVVSLPTRQRDISLRVNYLGCTIKKCSRRLVADETKRYFFEG